MPVDLNKLSISELEKLKKGYTKLYKTKLIDEIKKLRKETEQVKPTPKEPKMKKPKTFEQYFQECIQNKRIPPDTPLYLRKALERAMREHTQGIVREKSAFEDFANKYIIDGEPGLLPLEFFRRQKEYLKEFLKNHKNTKVRFVLVCMMEKQEGNEKLLFKVQDKAYFHSNLHINLESTNEKDLLASVIHTILEKINIYQQNGSGWYFKEIVNLEIHTVDYRPMKGGSYILLSDWIMRKKAIVSLRNKDKCFIWSILRYLYTKKTPNDDIPSIFVSKLEKVVHKIYQDFYSRPLPLRMTQEQRVSYSKSEKCHICNEDILTPDDKVCDHCHFTGEYRGAAHQSCNLQCRKPMIIPVIFHNLQGYDAHLFIKQLSKLNGDLFCIPSTEEKYISFSKKIKVDEYQSRNLRTVSLYLELRFIDSYKFLQTSLANLVKNLQPDDFYNTKTVIQEPKALELLTRKGVYPYDYISSIETLTETQLPPKDSFY